MVQVVEVKLRSGLLLLGQPGSFPVAMIRTGDAHAVHGGLEELRRDSLALSHLRSSWTKLGQSREQVHLSDNEFAHSVADLLQRRAICAVFLPSRAASLRQASTPGDTPAKTIADLSESEKIGRALKLSLKHLPADMAEAVATMVLAELGIWIAGFLAVAVAQLWPPAGAAIDAVILGVLWTLVGWSAWSALKDVGVATLTAMHATTEADLEKAGALYAQFFAMIGLAGMAAVRAKFLQGRLAEPTAKAEPAAKVRTDASTRPASNSHGNRSSPTNDLKTSSDLSKVKFGQRGIYTEPGVQPPNEQNLREIASSKLREGALPPTKEGWPPITASDAATFKDPPEAITLKERQRIYRVIDSKSDPNGSYWTTTDPRTISEADWRSGAAVKGEWNGDGAFVEYEIPEGGLNVWSGNAAPQMSSDSVNVLGGGQNQIWLPRGSTSASSPISTGWVR